MAGLPEDTVTTLPRKFIYEGLVLDDVDPGASVEEILALYSEHYPALVGAGVEGPEIKEDSISYKFVTKIGTKGAVKDKTPDFSLMESLASILLRKDDEDGTRELPPSEAQGVIG